MSTYCPVAGYTEMTPELKLKTRRELRATMTLAEKAADDAAFAADQRAIRAAAHRAEEKKNRIAANKNGGIALPVSKKTKDGKEGKEGK